jgi:lysophospholipase L1-like esterase
MTLARWRSIALAFALGLALAALAAEGALRLLGYRPWPREAGSGPPLRHARDAQLGWVPEPGRYAVPVAGVETAVTIWANRTRAVAPEERGDDADVLVLGGSFSFGQDVGDSDSWAWQLQERLPDLRALNLAANAYGTYQSLIRLERYLEHARRPPRVVVYGFFDHHIARNVASWGWLVNLEQGNPGGAFHVPYATLDAEGRLRRAPQPGVYPRLPLRTTLAAVPLLERGLAVWSTRDRHGSGQRVTALLLAALEATSQRAGARLLVAALRWSPGSRTSFTRLLEAAEIPLVDCDDPRLRTPAWRVSSDGHPNARAHAHWAGCIAPVVEELAGS